MRKPNSLPHPADVEAARYGIRRSPQWPAAARAHLKLQPRCVCCADDAPSAPVHHVFPFHHCIALGRPDLELDGRNLVTLCESEAGHPGQNHHLLVGHLDSFQSSNLDAVHDATVTFHGLLGPAIRADARWLLEVKHRLQPLGSMTAAEKRAFAALMAGTFPRLEPAASPPTHRRVHRLAQDR